MSQTLRVGHIGDITAIVDRISDSNPDLIVEPVELACYDGPVSDAVIPDGVLDMVPEDALSSSEIDVFIGPMGGITMLSDDRFRLAAVTRRTDPSFIVTGGSPESIPEGASVTVCHPVVEKVLHDIRPDLDIRVVDGCDRLVEAACSGDHVIIPSHMSDLVDVPFEPLDPSVFVPVAGQGAHGVVYRKEDDWVRKAVYCVNHQETRITVSVETGIMKLMGAIQISPVAVNASMEFDAIKVRALSYGYTDEPRHAEGYLPMDYVMDEVLSFAEYLVGKRDYLL